MAYTQTLDITDEINAAASYTYILDTGAYSNCIVQVVGVSTIAITTTLDGGAVKGIIDNSAIGAINFTTCLGKKISDLTTTSTVATATPVIFENIGNYIKLVASGSSTKVLIKLYQSY